MAGRRTTIDVDAIGEATAGRCLEILEKVGGIDPAILDGQHHPCPKCGGTDRFRLIDKDAGAVLCNQCFSEKNGDVFAAIGWLLDLDFVNAAARMGKHFGIEQTNGTKRGRPKGNTNGAHQGRPGEGS